MMNINGVSLHPGILYQAGCTAIGEPVFDADKKEIDQILKAAKTLGLTDIPSIQSAIDEEDPDDLWRIQFCLVYTDVNGEPMAQWVNKNSVDLFY